MKFTVLWSLSWSCLLELVFHLIRHPSTMERLFKKNNNHICQVQLLTICHYSTFTYIPNTCCSCSSHSVNLLFLGSWKKSTQVTAEYRKIKLYSQTFCSDEGQTLTTSVRNSTWWPIYIINSLSVDKTKLSLSCNNIYEKITRLIGWKQVHFSCNTSENYKRHAHFQNFITPDFLRCIFHVNY